MSKDYDLEDRLIEFAVRIIQLAESRSDFIHKMKVCLKELRETKVWLKMIVRADLIKSDVKPVMEENDELISIFFTSISTAKKNLKRT